MENRAEETSGYLSLKMYLCHCGSGGASSTASKQQKSRPSRQPSEREPRTASHGSEKQPPTGRYKLDAEARVKIIILPFYVLVTKTWSPQAACGSSYPIMLAILRRITRPYSARAHPSGMLADEPIRVLGSGQRRSFGQL